MAFDTLLALAGFAFVSSITPGPNNFMLLTSGANFGFARTVPQMLGITIGFTLLLMGIGLGLGVLLTAFPMLHIALKIAGGAYLLYLAWRIAMSRALGSGGLTEQRPLTFLESTAFQWINPKAWMMALTGMAAYTNPEAPFHSMLVICIVFAIINLPSVAVWAGFGVALRGFLSDPVRLKWFNIAMGLLLVATLWPLLT